MLTLAISCLTTSNLPWFMDLRFQVCIQYCSLQHQNFTFATNTFTTEHHFRFGAVTSFLLVLLVNVFYSSQVAYCTPSNLGGSSSGIISFCFFILSMEFLRQEYWSGPRFPSPVDHILSELSTMTHLSWLALHAWLIAAWSYTSPFTVTKLWFMNGFITLGKDFLSRMQQN